MQQVQGLGHSTERLRNHSSILPHHSQVSPRCSLPGPSLVTDSLLTVDIANTNQCSYNYPSAMKYAYIPEPAQHDHPVPISVVLSQTRSRNAPLSLSLPVALTAASRFSRRGTFAAGSRLPTPAFGERNRGELSGGRSESIMKYAYQPSTFGLGYGVDSQTTSARQDLERMTEIIPIARVGTVDQNYEKGRGSPLRVVGGLPGVVAADGSGSDAGTSTGSRVEEKLKRMREKRKELEKV